MVLGGTDFGRGLDHEEGALMNGTGALAKRIQRDPYLLPPREDTSLQPGRGLLLDHAGTLISDFHPAEL